MSSENLYNGFNIVINGYKKLSEELINKEGIIDPEVAYNKYKHFFENDRIYDEYFKNCFSIVLCEHKLKEEDYHTQPTQAVPTSLSNPTTRPVQLLFPLVEYFCDVHVVEPMSCHYYP